MNQNRAKPRRFRNWVRLLAFLTPYKARFAAALFFAILNASTAVILVKVFPLIWSTIFPDASQNTISQANWGVIEKLCSRLVQSLTHLWSTSMKETVSTTTWVVATIFLVPFIMILRAFSDYLSKYFLSWVGTRIITDIRQNVFVHLQGLSLDYFNKGNVGDLISRIVNDCQQAQSAITTVIADSIKHPFAIIFLAYTVIQEDWKFSLAAIVLAPLCILPITIYGRKVRKTSKLSQENQGEIVSRLHENITGIRVVKAFHMEEYEKSKFWETCYRQFSYQMRIVRSINILSPLIEIIAALGVSAALVYAYHQQMPSGKLQGLLLGIFFLYDPIKNLSKLHTTIQKSLASTDRIFAILDTHSTIVEIPQPLELSPIQKKIEFENIYFRYDSDPVLKGLSLSIPHGSTTALVGPSGVGKTTLLNLIPRFYDPTEGRILIDGVDLKNVSLQSLRHQIALVSQDTILFNDTIYNNIRYGSMEASEEKIIEAAQKAHAHEFILHQPFGYQTIVGDKGVKLSGGQKQRLAIARAILKNPAILLLDEATSALDTESERLVQQALDELVQGRTVIVIAHRLSTVQRADLIIVMEDGQILEKGKHEELLTRGNLYRKLYDLQFREI